MATTQLTFGGTPLLFDAESQVCDFLERFLPLNEMVGFAQPAYGRGGRSDNRSGNFRGIGLPQGGYPAPPPMRINHLYWPTGATRWAAGVFLADREGKAEIEAQAYGSGTHTPLTLLAGDGNRNLQTSLYLLPPRPVNTFTGGRSDLWALPLVDERYFWQFANFGDTEVTASSTWSTLLNSLATALGIVTLGDTPDANYLIPDPEEFSRRYDNPAAMLDAVALSVGQRVVRQFDGSVSHYSWDSSAEAYLRNMAVSRDRLAGGFIDRDPIPASVTVTTQRLIDHVANHEGRAKAYTKTAADTAPAALAARTSSQGKVIHSTAYADYSTNGGTGDPDNNTDLNNLATQIATDYYLGLRYNYDHTFAGPQPWTFSGYDDHALICFHRERSRLAATTIKRDGDRLVTEVGREFEVEAFTRIQSAPHNFAPEEQLSQDSGVVVLEPFQLVRLNGTLSADGSATASVYHGDDTRDDNTEADSTIDLKVYEFVRPLANAAFCAAGYDHESQRWYPIVDPDPAAVVSADSGSPVNLNHSDILAIEGGTNVDTAVAKVDNEITVTINASGSSYGWNVYVTGGANAAVLNTEAVQFIEGDGMDLSQGYAAPNHAVTIASRGQVRVDSGDPLAYLQEQFAATTITSGSGAARDTTGDDPSVNISVETVSGSNKALHAFIDSSGLSDHLPDLVQMLFHRSSTGSSQWAWSLPAYGFMRYFDTGGTTVEAGPATFPFTLSSRYQMSLSSGVLTLDSQSGNAEDGLYLVVYSFTAVPTSDLTTQEQGYFDCWADNGSGVIAGSQRHLSVTSLDGRGCRNNVMGFGLQSANGGSTFALKYNYNKASGGLEFPKIIAAGLGVIKILPRTN